MQEISWYPLLLVKNHINYLIIPVNVSDKSFFFNGTLFLKRLISIRLKSKE